MTRDEIVRNVHIRLAPTGRTVGNPVILTINSRTPQKSVATSKNLALGLAERRLTFSKQHSHVFLGVMATPGYSLLLIRGAKQVSYLVFLRQLAKK